MGWQALLREQHCTTHLSSLKFTMVASPWLVNAHDAAEERLRLRQEQQQPPRILPQPDCSSDGECSDCSEENNSSDMSTNGFNLSEYGPTIEEHRACIASQLDGLGSKSTKNQYGRKLEEYQEFSKTVFGDDEIAVDRVLKFLQFQAHREVRVKKDPQQEPIEAIVGQKRKRKSTRVKKTDNTKASKYVFKIEDYTKVMDHIQKDIAGLGPENWIIKNRLHSISKYYQALLRHASDEVRLAMQNNKAITTLVENVQRRTKMIKVHFDEDCLNKITEKFKYPQLYKLSEGYFWDEHKSRSNWKNLTTCFRNRYNFLSSVQTCTRHEATLSSMLQAFEIVEYQMADELQPYHILVRNIYKGKTNQEDSATVLQAKSIRHRDPKFCEQGALAIFLFARFRVHDEEFDLDHNSKWLKVRVTVPVNNNKKQFDVSRCSLMTPGPYYEKLNKVFHYFGYNTSHVIHFGRSCAPVLLEFAEVMTSSIEQLGNWRHDTYNKSYSLNLPWDALRAAAGFKKEKGFYRLPRSKLPVPEGLRKLVFPNVERAKQNFLNLPKQQQYCLPMATKFLTVIEHLAGVFVQDICQLRYEGRDTHQLYKDPFFQHPLFVSYEARFRITFAEENNPRNDPTIDPIKKAAPLMGHHLGDLKGITYHGFNSIDRQLSCLHQQNELMHATMTRQLHVSQHIQRVIGSAVTAAHAAHTNADLMDSPTIPQVGSPANACSPPITRHFFGGVTPSPQQRTQTEDNPCPTQCPVFDRLCYESIEQMHNDWFGTDNSPYCSHGGIKGLYNNKQWRKSLGSEANKREADKKMLQKMKRIGDYFEKEMSNGKTMEEIAAFLRELISKSPKTKETLTGIDSLLKNRYKDSSATAKDTLT